MKIWSEGILKDFIVLGNGKERPLKNGPIPVFGGNGILSYCNKSNYSGKTIIIGRVGAYCGAVYYIDGDVWVSDNALSAHTKNNCDIKFMYYFLDNMHLNQFAEGSSHPLITHKLIYSLPAKIPSLPEQKAIAGILSNLDDKIDLLQRQNATLEAMAETLFRQWFIEEAQEDWEEFSLDCIADNIKEQAIPAALDCNTPYVGLEHIDKKNISLNRVGVSSEISSNKFYFRKYDILFGKLRPYFHKVCFAPFNGVCSTDILVIRPKQKTILPFCLFAFFQKDLIDFSDYASSGTRMPRTNWNILSQYKMKKPPCDKIKKFNIICQKYIDKIEKNQKQIRTLEKLRDTLLPKLMSGEVRVRVDG